MSKKGDGRPKAAIPQPASRTPRTEQPKPTGKVRPVFCFAHVDTGCDPRWAFNPSGDEAQEILAFLREMGRNTWTQILAMRSGGRPKHHGQEVDSFCSEAKRDFRKARLDERFGEEMFRFRLGSKKRLWGFRVGATFHVVWWDTDHKVYPTEPE